MQPFLSEKTREFAETVKFPTSGQTNLSHTTDTAELRFENNDDPTDYSLIRHYDNYTDVDDVLIVGGGTARNALKISSNDEAAMNGDADGDTLVIEADNVIKRSRFGYNVTYGSSAGYQNKYYAAGGTQYSPSNLADTSLIHIDQKHAYNNGWVRITDDRYYAGGDISLGAKSALTSTLYSYFKKEGTKLTWLQDNSESMVITDGIVTMPRQSSVYGYLNVDQTINYSVPTGWDQILFDIIAYDTQNEYSSNTFTVTETGVYNFTLHVSASYDSNMNYQRIGVRWNGNDSKRIMMYREAGDAHGILTDSIYMNAGDTLYFQLYHDAVAAPGSYTIYSGANLTTFSITKIA